MVELANSRQTYKYYLHQTPYLYMKTGKTMFEMLWVRNKYAIYYIYLTIFADPTYEFVHADFLQITTLNQKINIITTSPDHHLPWK